MSAPSRCSFCDWELPPFVMEALNMDEKSPVMIIMDYLRCPRFEPFHLPEGKLSVANTCFDGKEDRCFVFDVEKSDERFTATDAVYTKSTFFRDDDGTMAFRDEGALSFLIVKKEKRDVWMLSYYFLCPPSEAKAFFAWVEAANVLPKPPESICK